jgi:hypothetical protein
MLACVLVASAQWAQHTTGGASELMERGRKMLAGQTLSGVDPYAPPKLYAEPDMYAVQKMSYSKGESHMINDVFSQESSKDELEDVVYQLVHPELLTELQHEIEAEMEEEVQAAVKKEQQEYYLRTTAKIQTEMGSVMDDVDRQKNINTKFSNMVTRAKELENEICKGKPCEKWDELLAGAQKKVDALEKALAIERKHHQADVKMESEKDKDETALLDSAEANAGNLEEDLTYWHGLANVYYAMLHPRTTPMPIQTPPPPPPHCAGLKTIYGPTGSISTGPAGTYIHTYIHACMHACINIHTCMRVRRLSAVLLTRTTWFRHGDGPRAQRLPLDYQIS